MAEQWTDVGTLYQVNKYAPSCTTTVSQKQKHVVYNQKYIIRRKTHLHIGNKSTPAMHEWYQNDLNKEVTIHGERSEW